MSLKVIGGMAKGHTIIIPKSGSFRPTSIRLKRRLYDFRQNWEGLTFVDLCAGSGAMGIEAWSRGAKEVILVENNKQTVSLINKNIKSINTKYSSELDERPINAIGKSVTSWINRDLETLLSRDQEVVLFLDPPYANIELYKDSLKKIKNFFELFRFECWIESDRVKGITLEALEEIAGKNIKKFDQGTTFLALFHQ